MNIKHKKYLLIFVLSIIISVCVYKIYVNYSEFNQYREDRNIERTIYNTKGRVLGAFLREYLFNENPKSKILLLRLSFNDCNPMPKHEYEEITGFYKTFDTHAVDIKTLRFKFKYDLSKDDPEMLQSPYELFPDQIFSKVENYLATVDYDIIIFLNYPFQRVSELSYWKNKRKSQVVFFAAEDKDPEIKILKEEGVLLAYIGHLPGYNELDGAISKLPPYKNNSAIYKEIFNLRYIIRCFKVSKLKR